MIDYVKCFDSNKTMYFMVNDNKLLKKYDKILKKKSNLVNIVLSFTALIEALLKIFL